MLNIISGGAGCGKTYEMMNRIEVAVKAGKNVLVIIPEQFSFEFDRALYERIGMKLFNRVEVLPFSKIAKEIFIEHGGLKGKYADDTVRNITMFRALKSLTKRDGFNFYNRQAKSNRFIESSLEVVKELTMSGITVEQITNCAHNLDNDIWHKISDIALIYSEYTKQLADSGYKDGASDVSEAAKRAQLHDYFNGKTVFIDYFKSFTADEYAMLDAIISQSESTTICLCTGDEKARDFSVFETVNKTRNRLIRIAQEHNVDISSIKLDETKRFSNNELAFMSNNILRNIRSKYDGECNAVKVYRSADCYGEGDFVCSEIRRLVAEEGYRYRDIAVLARQKESYSSAMESAFERYDVPFYTDENHNAAHKALFIFIKMALQLAANPNATGEEWLRYIKTGMLGINDNAIEAIESYCYKWNVDGKMWSESFDTKETGKTEETEEISYTEKYRKRITEPIFKLRERCADAEGKEICAAIFDFMNEVKVNLVLGNRYKDCNTEDAAVLASIREIKQLWEQLCTLLETMGRVLSDEKIELKDFAELFANAVSKLKISAPPQTLDCVQFMAAHTARLAEPKVIFILGANEGIFPFAAKSSGLLNDRDRYILEENGVELSGSMKDKLSEERFVAYSVLSGASDKVYVSYASSDVSGKTLYPSLIIGQLCEMFGKEIASDFESRGMLSFCTTANAAYYQYVQNYKRNDADSASLRKALTDIHEYKSRIEYLQSVEKAAAHSLTNETGKKLFGTTVSLSASRFEDYRKCPFMYFCQKGLSLYPPEKIEFNRPSKGTVIHYCLSEFMKAHKSEFEKLNNKTTDSTAANNAASDSANSDNTAANSTSSGNEPFDRTTINTEMKKYLKEYYESDNIGGDYGKSERYKAAYFGLADTLTDIIVRLVDEFKQSMFVPSDFEYKIGTKEGEKKYEITVENDIKIQFEGSVDRIDVFKDKDTGKTYVRVIDYKSGTKEFDFNDLLYGINMQMLLYLFAIIDDTSEGKYNGAIPAGVLYMPAKDAYGDLGRNGNADDESSRKKVYNSVYKMSGTVLCETCSKDDLVVKAMENDCNGDYIPIKFKKEKVKKTDKKDKGAKSETYIFDPKATPITSDELDKLKNYSRTLLQETVKAMTDGKIEAEPLQTGTSILCSYCNYKSICGNYPPVSPRVYSDDTEKKINGIMGRGGK